MEKNSYQQIIESDKPVLVDFTASWCGPCKQLAPILVQVKERIGDAAKIIKVDVDKNPALASSLHIQGVPTLILYKNGQIVWRQSGVQSAEMLTKLIQQFS